MKPLSLIVLSGLLLVLSGCEQKYVVKKDGVYLKGWDEGRGKYEDLVEGADPKTFESVETNYGIYIGKDKQHVFFSTMIMDSIDPKSFKYIGNNYFVDKKYACFYGAYHDFRSCKIDGVNPQKLELYSIYPWAHDDKYIIYPNPNVITQIQNIESFHPITERWGKTNDKILYQGKILDSVDFATFKIIDEIYAEDKFHKYAYGQIK